MRTASSASRTNMELRSASVYMAIVVSGEPRSISSSRAARISRIAASPRLTIATLLNAAWWRSSPVLMPLISSRSHQPELEHSLASQAVAKVPGHQQKPGAAGHACLGGQSSRNADRGQQLVQVRGRYAAFDQPADVPTERDHLCVLSRP